MNESSTRAGVPDATPPGATGETRSRARGVVFRLLAVLLTFAMLFAISEVTIRLFLPRSMWAFHDATGDWQTDARKGWVQAGGLNVQTRPDPGVVVEFRTNEDGLTPPEAQRPRTAGVPRILIVGDSTVVGRRVTPDQTIHARLTQRLREAGAAVEVYNAGVQAYSTDQELIRVEELLPLYRPDVVLLCVCDNDFGGIQVDRAYGHNKPRFALESTGELREIPCAPNPRIRRLGSGPTLWIQSSATYRLMAPLIGSIRARFASRDDRSLLGLAPEYYYDQDAVEEINWPLFTALLRRMKASCEQHDARLLVYAHPAPAEVWQPYIDSVLQVLKVPPSRFDRYALEKRIAAAAQSADLAFVPMIDEFLSRATRGPFHFLPSDPHCNAAGYDIQAEVLSAALLRLGWLGQF